MSCRCNDISRCTSDISKINEMKSLFSNANSTNCSVSIELQKLAVNCMTTFSCINMSELMSEEKKLNKDVTESLPKLIKKCEEKTQQLEAEKSAMITEDIEYHSEDD